MSALAAFFRCSQVAWARNTESPVEIVFDRKLCCGSGTTVQALHSVLETFCRIRVSEPGVGCCIQMYVAAAAGMIGTDACRLVLWTDEPARL